MSDTNLNPDTRSRAQQEIFHILWEIPAGAFRKFIWKDLRVGMVDLKGLPRSTQAIARLGFLVLGVLILLILFNNTLRSQFSLIPLLNSSSYAPGRGVSLPGVLAPITQVFITLAWSYTLTGVLHSKLAIRISVLFVYMLGALRQILWLAIITFSMSIGGQDYAVLITEIIVVLAVPLVFLLAAFMPPKPALEFVVLLIFITLTFFLPLVRGTLYYNHTGEPLSQGFLQISITNFTLLAIPFVLQIGFNIADFTQQVSSWLSETVAWVLPRRGLAAALFILLGWRIVMSTKEEIERLRVNGLGEEILEYAGAFGVLICVGLVWLLVNQLSKSKLRDNISPEILTESAEKSSFVVIALFVFPLLLNYLVSSMTSLVPLAFFQRGAMSLSNFFNDNAISWQIAAGFFIFLTSLEFSRRGKRGLGLYLGVMGLLSIYSDLTKPGYPLEAIGWRGTLPENSWWLFIIVLAYIYLLIKKSFTRQKLEDLFLMTFLLFLVRQSNFIEDPFSPFFGFMGVGFIAFGVIWSALTSGGWANKNTPALSRSGRIFLYLGYVIMTQTIINWMLATHELVWLDQLTGKGALAGFQRFGLPMIYSVFVLTLTRVVKTKELPHGEPQGFHPTN
jgi:hypothetical protein